SEAEAKTAWKRLAAKYPDILGPLAMHMEKVDLGTKGIYYRVQAGPFTDKNAARDICTKLKPKGQPCLVKP
ncbi:MAG TPA: SPOR domain-containing protein, partial [Verrucomicrobiae bacterium]|nr:SPOR domain-containing protein [Verrucomicrobiae bacterium]